MNLEKLVMFALICAAGCVAYMVGAELRKRKIDRENREREKADKELQKTRKRTKRKRSP